MPLKEQKSEVKAIILVCPEYFNNQKKLDELKKQVTALIVEENSLKDDSRKKIFVLKGLIDLIRYYKDKAKRDPNYLKAAALDHV
jgi:hypothetical protein